jgi:hypothetical protein
MNNKMKNLNKIALRETRNDLASFMMACGGFFGGLLEGTISEVVTFPTFIRKGLSNRKKSFKYCNDNEGITPFQQGYAHGYTLLTAPLVGFLPPALAWGFFSELSKKNTSLGYTALGLIGTNVLSGLYELYRSNKNSIK